MTALFGGGDTVLTNTIVMWSGNLADIPDGWVLCDGNNGTPNLLGKFPRSVPDGSTNPGGTGGTDSYTLSESQMASHAHGGGTQSVGDHNHVWGATTSDSEEPSGALTADSSDNTYSTSTDGDHTHTLNTDTTGSGGSIDNRPAFHEVAYIMKT